MKLYRVRVSFTNGTGMIREGQIFLVREVSNLPLAHGLSWDKTKDFYQEVSVKGPFGMIEIEKYLTLENLK